MRYGQKTKPPAKDQATHQALSTSSALLNVQGTWSGSSVSWDITTGPKTSEPACISSAELKALQKKHGSTNVNTARIEQVKQLMQKGCTQIQIIHKLKGRRGFGERQIKKDMAALSKLSK